MQTKNYGDLFTFIQALIGAGTLTVPECRIIHQFINQRLQEAYNTTQSWPRYLVSSEKRDINSLEVKGSATGTVNQNYRIRGEDANGFNVYQGVSTDTAFVFRSGTTWVIKTAGTLSESDDIYSVSGGVTRHTEQDSSKKSHPFEVETYSNNNGGALEVNQINLIPYAESSKDTIAEFFRIHRKKAFINQSQLEYDFFITVDGAHILNTATISEESAFVTYKKSQAFLTITEGGTPNASNYTDNTSVQVPLEFYNFIANGAHADFLRVERRFDEALQADNKAQNYLAQELEKLDIIANNNNLKKKFSTHLNRNSR